MLGCDCDSLRGCVQDWGSHEFVHRRDNLYESLLDLVEVNGFLNIFCLLDEEVNNCRSFIHRDYLDVGSMDPKNCCHSVCKGHYATTCEEFFDCEFKSDTEHDRITRNHIESTAWFDPELQSIDDSLEPIFTTSLLSGDFSPSFGVVVPFSWLYDLLVRVVYCISSCIWIVDAHTETRRASRSVQSELLLLRRCTSVLNNVAVSSLINDCWESLLSLLTSVEALPAVVLIGIQSIVEAELFATFA